VFAALAAMGQQRLGVRTDKVRIVAADDPKIDAQVTPLRPSQLGKSLY
jgi:hypothetical protein